MCLLSRRSEVRMPLAARNFSLCVVAAPKDLPLPGHLSVGIRMIQRGLPHFVESPKPCRSQLKRVLCESAPANQTYGS